MKRILPPKSGKRERNDDLRTGGETIPEKDGKFLFFHAVRLKKKRKQVIITGPVPEPFRSGKLPNLRQGSGCAGNPRDTGGDGKGINRIEEVLR